MNSKEASSSSYKSILKTTSLFASVKVITIIINLIKNKVVAILLGASGIGLLGIFTTTLNLINSFSDLGLSKSAVRNISAANTENLAETSKIVSIYSKLLFIISLISALLSAIFGKYLSILVFGNSDYTWSFVGLSIAVFFNSISTGQLAILQGMRQLKALAKASSIGAFLGMIASLPLFYFFKEQGIVPSIILSFIVSFLLSTYFVRKNDFQKVNISKSERNVHGKDMLKLGIAMMCVSFMVALSGFVLRAYINKNSGVNTVGLFQAGFTIITGYFGMIFTAMSTDYFPRLSSISDDNIRIEVEVNQQSIIALVLLCPLIVILLFIMPFFIEVLYTSKFLLTVSYVNWAIYGVIFQAVGQTLGMVLLAKNRSSIFLIFVFIMQLFFLIVSVVFFDYLNLKGLGIGYSINMLVYMLALQILIKKLYDIKFSREFYEILFVLLLLTTAAFLLKDLELLWIKCLCGLLLIALSSLYSIVKLKKVLGVKSFYLLIKNKLKK